MEDFALLGIVFFLYIIFSFFAFIVLLNRTKDMGVKLEVLYRRLNDLAKEGLKAKAESTPAKSMETYKQEFQKPVTPPAATPPVTPTPPVAEPVLRSTPPEPPKPVAPTPAPIIPETPKPVVTAASTIPGARPVTPRPPQPPKPPKPGFLERNPDLEKFIGENLINKIGIAILVLGIGFFVKFAIDKNWINEFGRVAIGVLCGGILIGTAHYLRNSYRGFSSVLVGGGVATLYFTFTIAFQLYQIPAEPAFAFLIMVLITLFTVILSVAYDRQELAVLGIIGGFGAPIMVSTGQGNYIILFTYIAILNIGMLILAYYKRWNLINVVSFAFTVILYAAWMTTTLAKENAVFPYVGALIFATVFYLIFFLMNIINNIKEKKQFVAFEFSLLLANTVAYYSAGMYILKTLNEGLYQGLFTALLAVFNFAFAYTLFRTNKVDRNVIYLLIGLVMTFITLAAPIQLKGNYITLFWAAEAVLLLWLSQKSEIKLMKLGSIIINSLMCISLIMDWNNVYNMGATQENIIFNKAFLTTVAVVVSLFLTGLLLKKEDDLMGIGLEKKFYQGFLSITLGLLAYAGGMYELYYQLDSRLMWTGYLESMLVIDMLLYTVTFVVLIQGIQLFLKKAKNLLFSIIASLPLTLVYTVLGFICTTELRNAHFHPSTEPLPDIHYYMHYPLSIMFLVMIVLNLYLLKRKDPSGAFLKKYLWVFCGILLFILSAELEHLFVWSRADNLREVYSVRNHIYKVGFPILWGIAGFTAMIIGMIRKIRVLRIISLVIFAITLLKLAIFDIKEMSEGGKIAAFILLGVLLLIMSFMYQKLKKIIIEDKNETAE